MAILDEINKVGRWLHQNFWALNFWLRSMIAALIGAAAGAVILAVLNRIALYGYAISEDLRVPIKGMPYLDVVALLLAFFLLMVILFTGFVIYNILLLISKWLAGLFRVKSDRGKKGIDIAIGVVSLAAAVSILISSPFKDSYLKQVHEGFESLMGIDPPKAFDWAVPMIFVIASVVVILIAVTKVNSIFRWVAALVTFIGTIVILASVFQPQYYSAFLKKIKYGGGIPIEVTYRIDEKEKAETKGELYILTGDHVVIKDLEAGAVIEIPRNRIIRMKY